MRQRNVLVTGASGFIGTHLVRSLSSRGIDVVAVDLKEPREKFPNVDYRNADVRNLSDLNLLGNIDSIYNFAAVHTTPGHPPHEYYETNVLGAVEVTRLAERLNIPEIIFTSSISVYGPGEETKTEDSLPTPESAYGYSKLIAESIHKAWLERNDARKLTIARPAVVFGQGEGGNFTRMAKLLRKGIFVYPGRKDTIKACIHVKDLLQAIEFARDFPDRLVLFNGAYPERYTLEQIVSMLISQHFPKARTAMVPQNVVSSAAKALGAANVMKLGIHPDRVKKLVRSTDIFPAWLVRHQFPFPPSLDDVLLRWRDETGGTFV